MHGAMRAVDPRHEDSADDIQPVEWPREPIVQWQVNQTAVAEDFEQDVEDQERRAQASFPSGNVTADGREIAHRRRSDRSGSLQEKRGPLGEQPALLDRSQAGEGADPHRYPGLGDSGEIADTGEVDEARRPRLAAQPFELQSRACGDETAVARFPRKARRLLQARRSQHAEPAGHRPPSR